MKKPVLLLVSRNYPPLVGGMERLNQKMLLELAKDYQTVLVGPEHAPVVDGVPEHLWQCSMAAPGRFLVSALFKTLVAARRLKPDIVLAGSGLTAPIVWFAARLFKARCLVYLHGLDIEVKHRFYQCLWPPFFRRFDGVIVNSHFTQDLAVKAGVAPERIHIVHPGVALPDRQQSAEKRQTFRKQHHLGDAPVLLYVGRIIERKGLLPFVQYVLPKVIAKYPDVQLLVVGDNPDQALLKQNDERQLVKNALVAQNLEERVFFLGSVSDEELNAAYFAADVLIFPVQPCLHDSEGFGMVAIEAAAHGLPTVAFAAGGVPDAVADGVSGRLVAAGDNSGFAQAVCELLAAPAARYRDSCRSFAQAFAWDAFGRNIREICHYFGR